MLSYDQGPSTWRARRGTVDHAAWRRFFDTRGDVRFQEVEMLSAAMVSQIERKYSEIL